MKPGRMILTFIILMTMLSSGSKLLAQVRTLYVNVPQENLRNAPNGRKLGSLLEGTETVVLYEKDNWVKIQITGWMWKPSLSAVKKSAAEGEFRALHIMVKTKAEAEEILRELNAGKDFSELAKAKSIAPSAAAGGDLGYFNKGDFNPVFEKAITSLKVNQVSGIVEAANGYNIFKRIK